MRALRRSPSRRPPARHPEIALGASPRASLGIYQAAQAWAGIAGRDFVLPDDVKRIAPAVLIHRLMIAPQAQLRAASSSMSWWRASSSACPVPVEA